MRLYSLKVFLILGLCILLAACARSLDADMVINPKLSQIANSETGPEVALVEIVDKRNFSVVETWTGFGQSFLITALAGRHLTDPKDPEFQSVKTQKELNEPALLAQTIGRTYSETGIAFGSIRLQKGQTIIELVRAALENGLRRSGFRVVKKAGPQVQNLRAEILNYWFWNDRDYDLHHDAKIKLVGSWPNGVEDAVISFRLKRDTNSYEKHVLEDVVDQNNMQLSVALKNKLGSPPK